MRQLDKVARQVLVTLAAHTPLLPGKQVLAVPDIDSMQRRTYGYTKQGSGFGHTKIGGKSVLVRGLNVLAVTLSTPLAAPVVAATRLRGGSAGSARGAASLVRESIPAARAAGCSGTLIVRGDSAFYSAEVIGACRDQHARFSVTANWTPRSKQRSQPSTRAPGPRSPTLERSSMSRPAAGSPTPRSPRSATPPSPAPRARPSPPG
nr:transposase [Nonomuraea zeae]